MTEKTNKKTTGKNSNAFLIVCAIILFFVFGVAIYTIINFFTPSNDVNLGELQTWINSNNLTGEPYWVWEQALNAECIKQCGDLKYNGYTASCNYIVCQCGNKIRCSSC